MRPFACDGIVIRDGKILLIKRGAEPFKGMWAIPGGRIEDNESAEQCLKREMKEETGLEIEPGSLLGIYSDPNRDPRKVIVAVYMCKITGGKEQAGDDAAELAWFELSKAPKLAADHDKMIGDLRKAPSERSSAF